MFKVRNMLIVVLIDNECCDWEGTQVLNWLLTAVTELLMQITEPGVKFGS